MPGDEIDSFHEVLCAWCYAVSPRVRLLVAKHSEAPILLMDRCHKIAAFTELEASAHPIFEKIRLLQDVIDGSEQGVEVHRVAGQVERQTLKQQQDALPRQTCHPTVGVEQVRPNAAGMLEDGPVPEIVWCPETRKGHDPVVAPSPGGQPDGVTVSDRRHLNGRAQVGPSSHRAWMGDDHGEPTVTVGTGNDDALEDIAGEDRPIGLDLVASSEVQLISGRRAIQIGHDLPTGDAANPQIPVGGEEHLEFARGCGSAPARIQLVEKLLR